MDATAVETKLFTPTADHDEVRYAAFVAKTLRGYVRARDKANAKGKPEAMYYGWTDAECAEAAGFYCRAYRHQFRVYRAADGETL